MLLYMGHKMEILGFYCERKCYYLGTDKIICDIIITQSHVWFMLECWQTL